MINYSLWSCLISVSSGELCGGAAGFQAHRAPLVHVVHMRVPEHISLVLLGEGVWGCS